MNICQWPGCDSPAKKKYCIPHGHKRSKQQAYEAKRKKGRISRPCPEVGSPKGYSAMIKAWLRGTSDYDNSSFNEKELAL